MLARRIFHLSFYLCLGLLAFVIWNRWPSLSHAQGWLHLLLFYGLPILALATLCRWMVVTRAVDPNLGLISLISVAIPLYAFEIFIGLQMFDLNAKIEQAAVRFGLEYDPRTAGQVVAELRSKGVPAQPALRVMSKADLMPLGHMPQSPIVYCNEMGQFMQYVTDRHGFNNPNEVWDQPKNPTIFLGDSFTEGACAVANDGFVQRLQQSDPAILNLGMGGNGPLGNLATIVEYVVPRAPEIVFWVHYAGNDPGNLNIEKTYPILIQYLNPGYHQNLISRSDDVAAYLGKFFEKEVMPTLHQVTEPVTLTQYLSQKKYLIHTAKLYRTRQIFGLTRDVAEEFDLNLLAQVFDRAATIARTQPFKLVIVNMPASGLAGLNDTEIERRIALIWQELSLEVLDLKPLFKAQPDPGAHYAFGSNGGHLSPQGNALVAEFLKKYLDQR